MKQRKKLPIHTIRFPMPPPTKIHSTEGGARDYKRSENRWQERRAIRGYE